MKNTPVTLKVIAQELHLSLSTVSRALRGMPEVRAGTRAAVHRLAAELDYQPNQLAKNLAHSRTKTIGVIIPNTSYHFYSALLNSIEEAALQAGYSVLVCQSNESHLRERTNLQNLLRSQVEGILVSFARDTTSYEHLERLARKGFPLVLFDRYVEELHASKVISDDFGAAFTATEHLIGQGCRRIGFLAGPPNLFISNQRLAGYQAALAQHGLPPRPQHVEHCDLTQDNAIAQTLQLMKTSPPPDGLVVASHRIAYPALFALKQKGVRIPADVAIVSFNNEPLAALQSPSLTSVSHPIPEMGTETVRLLLKQLESEEPSEPETTVFQTQLIVRESSVRRQPVAS